MFVKIKQIHLGTLPPGAPDTVRQETRCSPEAKLVSQLISAQMKYASRPTWRPDYTRLVWMVRSLLILMCMSAPFFLYMVAETLEFTQLGRT